MKIASLHPDIFSEYLGLVDQEIRPAEAATHIWEDFPLLLGGENLPWILGGFENRELVAGAACLVRQFRTSCGAVPVGGIGCVVTRPEFRGRGLSGELQAALISRLVAANVPLAVLWSDKPEVYAGRGFRPAGWEFHVDLQDVPSGSGFPQGFRCRPFREQDVAAVSALYARHPLRTQRNPGDSARLYTMPGTRGLVAVGQGEEVVAAVFCGKGADFHQYVGEWCGPGGLVMALLDEALAAGWARHVLIPAGAQSLAEALTRRGAVARAQPSGLWVVTQPEQLSRYLQGSGLGAPADPADPAKILGSVDSQGVVVPGALTLAVWGFDSV